MNLLRSRKPRGSRDVVLGGLQVHVQSAFVKIPLTASTLGTQMRPWVCYTLHLDEWRVTWEPGVAGRRSLGRTSGQVSLLQPLHRGGPGLAARS